MELIHLPEAAEELGVSYATLKQWIYRGKIRSVRTAGGHHRIPRPEIDRVLFQQRAAAGRSTAPHRLKRTSTHHVGGSGLEYMISGRNQLLGRVTSLRRVGLLAKVTLDVGGQSVTSIITSDACRELGLKVGDTAAALIKATEVMIIRPRWRREASARPSPIRE